MSKAKKTISRADLKEFVAQATVDQLDFVVTMIQKKLCGEHFSPPMPVKKAKAPSPKPKRDASLLRIVHGNKK